MNRPVRTIDKSPVDWLLELIGLLGLIVSIGLVAYHYPKLPSEIPSHFSASGSPDKIGSKLSLLLLPAIGVVIFVALLITNRNPHRFNYVVQITDENATRQYTLAMTLIRAINAIVQLMLAYLVFSIIQTAYGIQEGIQTAGMIAFIGMLVIVPVVYVVRSLRKK